MNCINLKSFSFAVIFLSTTVSLQANAQNASPDYRITLKNNRYPDKPFVVNLPASNTEGITALESYISQGVIKDENGNPEIGIVLGTVEKTQPTSEHPWQFQLDPATVNFSDMTIELCDGEFQYVEDNLTEWMQNVRAFCPWNTREQVVKIEKVLQNKALKTIWSRN